MIDLEKVGYLCEIAFMYGATETYKRHNDKYLESGKDFDDMVLFYEMIYNEADERKDDCSLLDTIQTIIYNEKDMDRLMEKFLSFNK